MHAEASARHLRVHFAARILRPMKAEERSYIIGIVDDDRRVLESVGNLLESAGYDKRLFESGEAFLRGDAIEGVDALISDIRMPGMDGIELLQRVGTRRPQLPTILITASGLADLTAIRGTNYRGTFRKPIDAPALIETIAAALRSCADERRGNSR